ncbi:hypothetical protein Patl1_27346 [Pistacia atlantica]|uniref:Uncharacterized protein n=1 Tax=Pistacia atlantica TaxID=434234 RepID=A0ACC1BF78_9ROSI|nr:hypothetical protein Patl1_27346 [Pistacia atlantica]
MQVSQRVPLIISSRNEFSTAPQLNSSNKPGPTGKRPESKGNLSTVVVGTTVIAGAALLVYQSGYLDQYIGKENENAMSSHSDEEGLKLLWSKLCRMFRTDKDLPQPGTLNEIPVENQSHLQDKADLAPEDESVQRESPESKTIKEPKEVQATSISTQVSVVPDKDEETKKHEQKTMPHQHIITEDKSEDALGKGAEAPASLLEAYHLKDDTDEGATTKATEDYINAIEELNNDYLSKDGKLVFDFLQAIHAAEQRQAELDALMFAEEKRVLKEKYEKELRDSRARELMSTEEAAILEKKEQKRTAAIKSLQEKMEEKLRLELEQKESEAELKLKQAQELGKAELGCSNCT